MALSTSSPRQGRRSATGGLPAGALYRNIVGASPKMQRSLRLVSKVAATDGTVLLLGESGTGK